MLGGDPRLGLAQHRLADVDAEQAVAARIVRQRDAGADADLEDAAADPLRGPDRRGAAQRKHRAEHHVIDRRPARIGLFDKFLIERNFAAVLFHRLAPFRHRAASGTADRPTPVLHRSRPERPPRG